MTCKKCLMRKVFFAGPCARHRDAKPPGGPAGPIDTPPDPMMPWLYTQIALGSDTYTPPDYGGIGNSISDSFGSFSSDCSSGGGW